MIDTFRVAGPYTDQSFAVLSTAPSGKPISHGFFKTRGLAEQRLFQLRDERNSR
jgi:hypothetical protein